MDKFEAGPLGVPVPMHDADEPSVKMLALLDRQHEGDLLAGGDGVAIGIADDLEHGTPLWNGLESWGVRLVQLRNGMLMSSPVWARQRRRKTSHSASSRLVKIRSSSI